MHFHNPKDSASAMQCALRPDNWSAHQEAEYPAFQVIILPATLSFSDLRLDL